MSFMELARSRYSERYFDARPVEREKIEKILEAVSVPAIRDFPLTLECRVIYRQEQDTSQLPDVIRSQFYSRETGEHISYFGEIVDAYVIEEEA